MEEGNWQKQSDFWWLKSEEAIKYKYVYVCYQEPYSDESNSDKEPSSVTRYYSLDAFGNLSKRIERHPIDFINCWIRKNNNINVFRSSGLFSESQNGEILYGPVVIDIDREKYEEGVGYIQNLNDALEATRKIARDYLNQFEEDCYRLFFTGHKGFNIEIVPSAAGITSSGSGKRDFERIIDEINKKYGNNFVDRYHDFLRLHNSINRWISKDGIEDNRMKIELNIAELNSLNTKEIKEKSEKMAHIFLSK